jgi:hypothetical protein
MTQCQSVTTQGKQCARRVLIGHRYCWQHTSNWFKGVGIASAFAALLALIGLSADLVGLGVPIPTFSQKTDIKPEVLVDIPVDINGKWSQDLATAQSTKKLDLLQWGTKFSNYGAFRHKLLGEYSLLYKDRQSIVLAFQTAPDGFECHACAPYLSFFEYEKKPKGWQSINDEVAAVQAGSWGEFSAEGLSVRVIADSLYGVFLESGYTAQGHTNIGVTLFARIGDAFRPILDLQLAEGGFLKDDYGWSSTITMKPTNTGLYDLLVERKGNRGPQDLRWTDGPEERKPDVADNDGNVRPADLFKFNGQQYIRSDVFQ